MTPSARRVEAVTAAICESIITHLRCTYPQCGCKHAPIQARAAIAASDAALEADGMVIVPREPTIEMSDYAFMTVEIDDHSKRTLMEAGYRAMVNAAPGRSEPT